MKTMYALTYCFEGYDNAYPYATTIAISDDREKLVAEMNKCIEEDCREPENEECKYDTDINYSEYRRTSDEVQLVHNCNCDLYVTYKIHEVKVL